MKNPIGQAFQIERIKGVDYLGFVVNDIVNGIRYEVVDEPWVSILEAARTGGSGREPQYEDINIAFLGGDAPNKSYIEGLDAMPQFTTYEELLGYIYNVDLKGHNLTIHMAGTIPDMWIYTDRIIGCGELHIEFAGPAVPGASDGVFDLTAQNACIFPCTGIRIYGQVKTYINGGIVVEPATTSYTGGFGNLFYCENSYVVFNRLQILIQEGNWVKGNVSYPALFLTGMNAKVEFKERLIIGFMNNKNVSSKCYLPGRIMMALNYSYILIDSPCAATIRHYDKAKSAWSFSDNPFYAGRFAMLRLRPSTGGGYLGNFALLDSQVGCQAAHNGIIDTTTRFSEILTGCGLKTSRVSTQGQVVFG